MRRCQGTSKGQLRQKPLRVFLRMKVYSQLSRSLTLIVKSKHQIEKMNLQPYVFPKKDILVL